ncbi:phage tail tape measure protein [Murimonas intestini]|uniref:phage tail tape measure protein n=1 Tax=Murimonas intestini TaxID=1337051 RepID=UPI0011DC9315|nr:phage tail tape measure protein [Murimonas intestini]
MSKDDEILYKIRGDDSGLEKDLAAAEKKIEQSNKKSGEKTKQIEKETKDAQKKIKEELTSSHEEENEKREKSDKGIVRKTLGVMKNLGGKLKDMTVFAVKGITPQMEKLSEKAKDAVVASVKTTGNMDQAMNKFALSTGKTGDETERYKNILEGIYENNYGDSFSEIAEAMSQIHNQMGEVVDGWSDEGIQKFTESAFTLRDTFGYDIPQSAQAANILIDQFGMDGMDAMKMIAAGAKNGLDASGEFLDSISGYSSRFAEAGLGADDMFKIFQAGTETGAWGMEQIGNAIETFSVRALDGGQTAAEGFAAIGLNADDMAARFQAGGDIARQAFQDTVEGLASMEDPIARNAAGINLFGDAWEELGPEAMEILAGISEGAYDTAGALDCINSIKYNDAASMFEGLKRSVEDLLLPLGEQLTPVLSEIMQGILPIIQEQMPVLEDEISNFAQSLVPVIQEYLPILLDTVRDILPVLVSIVSEVLPILTDLFNAIVPLLVQFVSELLPPLVELCKMLIPPIAELIGEVLPILVSLVNSLMPLLDVVIALLGPLIDLFTWLLEPILAVTNSALIPMISAISQFISGAIEPLEEALADLGDFFSSVFEFIGLSADGMYGGLISVLSDLIDFIKYVFKGEWMNVWSSLVSAFGTIFSGLIGLFKAPVNFIIDLLNGFIDRLNDIKIPDWVWGIGGLGFSISHIPRLKVGMDYVPSDFFPAYLDRGEAVLTSEENMALRQLGGMQGIYALASQPRERENQSYPEVDYKQIAREFAGETKKALDGMGVNIDGKRAGELLAKPVDRALGEMTKRRDR